jgi:threonine/homoserine/homoserine lactone efflux protein
MLLLFGKYKDPARAIGGIALLVVGIVVHLVLLAVAGGVLIVWGAVRLLRARRSR